MTPLFTVASTDAQWSFGLITTPFFTTLPLLFFPHFNFHVLIFVVYCSNSLTPCRLIHPAEGEMLLGVFQSPLGYINSVSWSLIAQLSIKGEDNKSLVLKSGVKGDPLLLWYSTTGTKLRGHGLQWAKFNLNCRSTFALYKNRSGIVLLSLSQICFTSALHIPQTSVRQALKWRRHTCRLPQITARGCWSNSPWVLQEQLTVE